MTNARMMRYSDRLRHGPIGKSVLLLLFLLSTAFVLSCETAFGPMRASNLPPDFTYIPKQRLQTSMWVLASEIKMLEDLLRARSDSRTDAQRTSIAATLARMRVAAEALDEPGRSSQHPVLNENLDVFINRVDRAQRALDREPPDFYPASTIAGSCYLCHGSTKAAATSIGRKSTLGG